MRLGVVACEVLARELGAVMASANSICTVRWLPQGLHDTPDRLREQLQQQIDALEAWSASQPLHHALDAIVLGYGMCGGGTAGLHAGRLPLVLPRTDDCIGILLGARERYLELFARYPGIYWLSPGWLERANIPGERYYSAKHAGYAAQFGKDNADWLLEQENGWIARYGTCGYIAAPPAVIVPDSQLGRKFEAAARATATYCDWKFVQLEGSDRLLCALLAGDWDDRFVICPAHECTKRDFEEILLPPNV